MLTLSSYYGVPVIVSARTMVDQGGGPRSPFTRNDIRGLLSLKEEEEEEKEKEEKEARFLIKSNNPNLKGGEQPQPEGWGKP